MFIGLLPPIKKMRNYATVILMLTFFACETKKDELVGHWHSLKNEIGNFETLDINDSVSIYNQHDILGWSGKFPRVNNEGVQIIVSPHLSGTTHFEINGDTLRLENEYVFIRVEEESQMNDYFCNSVLQVQLEKSTESSFSFSELANQQLTQIIIGKLRNRNYSSKLMNLDSTYIQVNDVLIGYSDIKRFAQHEFDKWSNTPYSIVINQDKSTHSSTIDSIASILKPLDFIDDVLISNYNFELDRMEFERIGKGR